MKKPSLLLLVCALLITTLAGCTKPAEPEPAQELKIMYLAQSSAEATSNHHVATIGADCLANEWFVGRLYTWLPLPDRSGARLAPTLAASEPVNPTGDGKTWQVAINPEAKWANGEPIDAHTFIYSWKMLLDPKLANPQAMSLGKKTPVEIANAEAYFTQGSSDSISWDDVGIKALDDHTLEIVLVHSVSATEFMRHLSYQALGPVYEPLYEDHMNAERTATQYGTSVDKLMSSGPFKMVEWTPGRERVFEKNPHYVHADMVRLDGVVLHVVENPSTQLQMFENGELDQCAIPPTDFERYIDDPRYLPVASRYVRILEVNGKHPEKPLGNINLRRALYYAIDRVTLAELGKAIPSPMLVPNTSIADSIEGTRFRTIADAAGYVPENYGYDPELALDHFNKFLEEEGLTGISLTLSYASDTEHHVIIAEFLQESLSQIFGEDRFTLELEPMPSAQLLDLLYSSRTNYAAYELGLSQQSRSPTDFAATECFWLYTEYAGERRKGPYYSDRLNALYAESLTEDARQSESRIVELAMEMEKVFFEEVVAIPIMQNRGHWLKSERVVFPLDDEHISAGFCDAFADIKR